MITRRGFLKYIPSLPILVAIPAGIIGNRLGTASKAAEAKSKIDEIEKLMDKADKAKMWITFSDSDVMLDYVAELYPAAVKVRQIMDDNGTMSWTVLAVAKTKHLPKRGWDIIRENDRFDLHEIDRKQGMIHEFWIRESRALESTNSLAALLESVRDDHLLVRKEAGTWTVLLREESSKTVAYGPAQKAYGNFRISTIKEHAGYRLFEIWRSK